MEVLSTARKKEAGRKIRSADLAMFGWRGLLDIHRRWQRHRLNILFWMPLNEFNSAGLYPGNWCNIATLWDRL